MKGTDLPFTAYLLLIAVLTSSTLYFSQLSFWLGFSLHVLTASLCSIALVVWMQRSLNKVTLYYSALIRSTPSRSITLLDMQRTKKIEVEVSAIYCICVCALSIIVYWRLYGVA